MNPSGATHGGLEPREFVRRSGRYPPILPRDSAHSQPLSFSQQRLWFLCQCRQANVAYNVPWAWRLKGPLNTSAIESALSAVVARHESLRTTFHFSSSIPLQVVAPRVECKLEKLDLSRISERERDSEADRIIREKAQTPFDLARGPLFRFLLIRLAEQDHILFLNLHHIIADGSSMGLLGSELSRLYTSAVCGTAACLPQLPVQYRHYAAWHRNLLKDIQEEEVSAWRERLRELTSLAVPSDRQRHAAPSFQGRTLTWRFDPQLARGLSDLSRQQGVTQFMSMAAAFVCLLHRYAAQDDVTVGFLNAGRGRAELRNLIGYFVNTQVLRADCSGSPTFSSLLRRVREALLWAYAHGDVPFEKLVEAVQPERTPGRNPIFQVLIAEQKLPWKKLELAEIDATPLVIDNETSKFDLSLYYQSDGNELDGWLEYNSDIFDECTAVRMIGHLKTLVSAAVADPNCSISRLPILNESERHQLTVEWNQTQADYPRDRCIHDLFEEQAETSPEATGVFFGKTRMSYRELNRRANQMAHHLIRRGVCPGNFVGIALSRSPEMLIALLGIMKAGAAYVPLDPSYPRERLANMAQDAELKLILTLDEWSRQLGANDAVLVLMDGDATAIAEESASNPHVELQPDALAYVLYTSGSTGKPKGVLGLHRGAINRFSWMWHSFPFEAGEKCAAKTSLNFVDSVWELFGPLLAGVPLVLIPDDTVRDPARLVQTLSEEQVTRIVLVPSLLRTILEIDDIDLAQELRNLRYCISSGESLTADVIAQFYNRLPHAQLLNLYGSTEVAGDATFHPVTADSTATVIGRPIANMRTYILDSQLEPVPVGVVGQLYVGGEGLARGYLNRPDLTAERFIRDPFANDGQLYRTGDLARYRSDHRIEYLGRADRQIKIRGNRVELDEIEAVLGEHPGVEQSIVVWRDDKAGEGRLVAHVVPDPAFEHEDGTSLIADSDEHFAWREVWDEHYQRENGSRDPEFNINGWNSSYTGLPIPEREMREWVDGTVERLQRLKPRSVLEIGCGSGLLLFRVAPQSTRYVGTDFSPVVFDRLSKEVSRKNLPQVRLLQRTADDFTGLEPQSFDAVVLNSVVQYFDSMEYLMRVLEGAARLLTPGGAIFIGDVRDLRVLDAFHTSVQLHRAPPELSLAELRERVMKRVQQEHELLVDPAFFHHIAEHLQLGHCRVELKRATCRNEMACFRYDVTLQMGNASSNYDKAEFCWNRDGVDSNSLPEILGSTQADEVLLRGVPNARVSTAVRAATLLKNSDGRVKDLRDRLASSSTDGVDPEELWRVGSDKWTVDVLHDSSGPADGMNAWFRRRPLSTAASCIPKFQSARSSIPASWTRFANNPRRSISHRVLAADLRRFLQERLPDYMIPSVLAVRDSLPLLSNGKVDRQALALAEAARPELHRPYVGPGSQVERTIATVWRDVLQIDRVGVHDNFFDLGGHSLMLVRIHRELKRRVPQELSVTDLFRYPTVASLAGHMSLARGSRSSYPGIRPSRRAAIPGSRQLRKPDLA